jgi:trans-aconitate 2-methyltransferase
MGTDAWNPELYERFKRERIQPARDLIAMIQPKPDMRTIDLGCGTGEITRELHDTLGASSTLGVDYSRNMLAQAAQRATAGLEFLEADIGTYEPDGPVDLVYSNAALQWLDDHPALIRRVTGWLRGGGQVAIQVPCADWHPTHTVAAKVAEAFGTGLLYHGARRVLSPGAYSELLFSLGYREQHVVTRVYGHELESVEELVTFFSATLLNPYRTALGEDRFRSFLDEYRAVLVRELGDKRPTYFPMTRTLIWARR